VGLLQLHHDSRYLRRRRHGECNRRCEWVPSVDKRADHVDRRPGDAARSHFLFELLNEETTISGVEDRCDPGVEQRVEVPLVAEHIRVLTIPPTEQMNVKVREAREHCFPTCVDHARARWNRNRSRRAHSEWGETWTPGANWATTLDVSKTVKLNGHPATKGKYSVWMVVRQNREWTVVLDPRAHRYHMEPPDSSGAQIRFPVRVETAPFTDVLTWSMPELRIAGATLVMQWEKAGKVLTLTITHEDGTLKGRWDPKTST
jgi:hypothetical protein